MLAVAELDKSVGDGLEELARSDFAHLDRGHWDASANLSSDQQLRAAARVGRCPTTYLMRTHSSGSATTFCSPPGRASRASGVGAAKPS